MLGWIKYLQRVRVETDALKRNKDFGVYPNPSLPRSGRGGRRFKSCHSDQYLADPQDSGPTVSPTDIAASVFFVRRWSMLAEWLHCASPIS
jgi:hypothetical protein